MPDNAYLNVYADSITVFEGPGWPPKQNYTTGVFFPHVSACVDG
jgi:hypothetical protein